MEYVEGCDLLEFVKRRGPLTNGAIVDVLSQVLAALAVAHDMSVVHRDLKPENILIVRGTTDDGRVVDWVKVCDFGIAKILDASVAPEEQPRRRHSTTGLIVGTPAYMSPEQARGEKLDARSDLYSLGVVLYELLTGRVPFDAETPLGIALKHISDEPRAPSSSAPSLDPNLERICLKAIRKQPADRYQTAREMRQSLQNAAINPGVGTQQTLPAVHAAAPSDLQLRHDSTKPTLGGVSPTSATPQPKRPRAWLLAIPAASACALLLVWLRAAPNITTATGKPATSVPPPETPASARAEPLPSGIAPDEPSAPAAASVARQSELPSAKSRRAVSQGGRPTGEPPAPTTLPSPVPAAELQPAAPASPAVPALVPEPIPTPTRAPAPAPVPVAPVSAYDLTTARVSIGSARNVVGATSGSITRAVSEAAARITTCYKAALPTLNGAVEGAAVLHVDTDGAGVITDARLSGPLRGSVASCVAAAVQGHRVANVDTGNASADISLSFRAR
jgi:serine/threonine-protein kinase